MRIPESRTRFHRPRGLVLLLSAASLSVMAALAVAMLGAPASQQNQTQQFQAGYQARQNAESGYFFALSVLRDGGLEALQNLDPQAFELGADSFQISVVSRPSFTFTVRTDQTIAAGGTLTGISLPDGETLPRLDGRFTLDGVEYRYASYEADAGMMVGVERADGTTGDITIAASATPEVPPRTDIVSVGAYGGIQHTFSRQIEVLPSQGCPLPWGGHIPVGDSVLAYPNVDPSTCGAACNAQTRECQAVGLRPSGSRLLFEQVVQLSGSHDQQTCSAVSCECTTPWGVTVAEGSSVVAYETTAGTHELACKQRQEVRSCSGGILSGSFGFATCSDPEPQSCLTPLGATVADGASVVLYEHETPPLGQACNPQTRTCTDGFLSGWHVYDQCEGEVSACTTPWGGSVSSGSSVTAFMSASVEQGETCTSETRTCTNGVLAGSYLNQSCSVQSAPPPPPPEPSSCTTPWGETVEEGESVLAYREAIVTTGSCRSLRYQCEAGELTPGSSRLARAAHETGGFIYPSCVAQPVACSQAMGDPVLSLGPGRGNLINPVQKSNSPFHFYVWDINGNGTHNTGVDYNGDRIGKCALPWDPEHLASANGITFRIPTVAELQELRATGSQTNGFAPPGWNSTEDYWTGSVGRVEETDGDSTYTVEYLEGYGFNNDARLLHDQWTWPTTPIALSRFVPVLVENVTCNVPGNSALQLGQTPQSLGNLIHPFWVDGRWYYVWDVNASGTHLTGSDYSSDRTSHFGLRNPEPGGNAFPDAYACAIGGVCVRYPSESEMHAIREACIDGGEPDCYTPTGDHQYQDITPIPAGWASVDNYWIRPIGSMGLLSGFTETYDTVGPIDLSRYVALEVVEGGPFGVWGSVDHSWKRADQGLCQ